MRVKLTDICDIQYGYAFDSSMFSETEGTPLVRIRDVVRGFTETRTTESFPLEYAVHDGDILIGMDGEFNISRWHGGTAALNQRVCRLIPKDVDADYIFHFMPSALKAIEAKTPFVTVKHLSAKELNKITVPVPTPEEQIRIGTILNRILSIIDSRRRELANLDDLIKARFVEMFGDLKLNPKGWELHCFEQLSDVITDGEHATPRRATKGIYLLSARNVLNHAIQLDDVDYIDQEEYERISKRVVPQEGDILISCSGSVGRCCSVPAGLKFQMVRSAALVRFKEEISPIFAEYMITSDFVQEQIDASKTASSQANLFQGKIAKLKGFVPPRKLQDEFAAFVKQVDKSKLVVQKALDEAQLLFDGLMQKYFG